MGPFLPEVYHFPLFGIDVDDERCARECLAEIHRVFSSFRPPEEVAAVIIEPMQGDGGMLPAHPIFMQKLHELCREHGILFIAEEVQQAFFRTGTWFSIEHYAKYGVKPDGIVLGMSRGIVIVKLKGGRVLPDGDGSFKIIYRAYELGLIAITVSDSIIRIQPPLNISRENLVRGFELLSSAMDDFKAGKIGDDVLVHRRGCGI